MNQCPSGPLARPQTHTHTHRHTHKHTNTQTRHTFLNIAEASLTYSNSPNSTPRRNIEDRWEISNTHTNTQTHTRIKDNSHSFVENIPCVCNFAVKREWNIRNSHYALITLYCMVIICVRVYVHVCVCRTDIHRLPLLGHMGLGEWNCEMPMSPCIGVCVHAWAQCSRVNLIPISIMAPPTEKRPFLFPLSDTHTHTRTHTHSLRYMEAHTSIFPPKSQKLFKHPHSRKVHCSISDALTKCLQSQHAHHTLRGGRAELNPRI